MHASPPFQWTITELGLQHGIDFRFPNARLVLEQDGIGTLLIENASNRLLVAQRYQDDRDTIHTPIAILFINTPQWIGYSLVGDSGSIVAGDVSADGLRLDNLRQVLQQAVSDILIDWGIALRDGGWIEHGVVVAKDQGDESLAATAVTDLLRGLGIEAGVSR